MSPISRFENFARELIEGTIDRFLGEPNTLAAIAGSLVVAAENSQRDRMMASRYTVRLHPTALLQLREQSPNAADVLRGILISLGAEAQTTFDGEIEISFIADESVKEGSCEILAVAPESVDEPTAVLRRRRIQGAALDEAGAYLIVEGRRHVTLTKALVNIGRSLDNDVVVDNPGASRRHAQIRWRNGRYVIFDLGSRAGTIVNGQPVHEQILSPGDVVEIGHASMIFGQELNPEESEAHNSARAGDITQELSRDELP